MASPILFSSLRLNASLIWNGRSSDASGGERPCGYLRGDSGIQLLCVDGEKLTANAEDATGDEAGAVIHADILLETQHRLFHKISRISKP